MKPRNLIQVYNCYYYLRQHNCYVRSRKCQIIQNIAGAQVRTMWKNTILEKFEKNGLKLTSCFILLLVLIFMFRFLDSILLYRPSNFLFSDIMEKMKQSKISPLYSDLGLYVYGEWAQGFLHNRTTFTKGYLLKCNQSKTEKPLHFVFYNERLNKIDAVEKLKWILKRKKLLFVGDSLTREFFLGISALLGKQVNCS